MLDVVVALFVAGDMGIKGPKLKNLRGRRFQEATMPAKKKAAKKTAKKKKK